MPQRLQLQVRFYTLLTQRPHVGVFVNRMQLNTYCVCTDLTPISCANGVVLVSVLSASWREAFGQKGEAMAA